MAIAYYYNIIVSIPSLKKNASQKNTHDGGSIVFLRSIHALSLEPTLSGVDGSSNRSYPTELPPEEPIRRSWLAWNPFQRWASPMLQHLSIREIWRGEGGREGPRLAIVLRVEVGRYYMLRRLISSCESDTNSSVSFLCSHKDPS